MSEPDQHPARKRGGTGTQARLSNIPRRGVRLSDMGQVMPPPKARLICGILAIDEVALGRAVDALAAMFGHIEQAGPIWPFSATDYYADEMGDHLLRRFVSFAGDFSQERLPAVKRATNELESRLCAELGRPPQRRPVNLDPGYIELSRLVLATTKDHGHRIYLGEGIYAEVTLRYFRRRWTAWPWTYPDYAASTYHEFFDTVRRGLKRAQGEQVGHAST